MRPNAQDYEIRLLASLDEFEAIGRLQIEHLRIPPEDAFPPKLIMVAHENGGTAVGAFDPDGGLVGFAINFPGNRYGRLIEWSYILGVAPQARGCDLELRLKLAQRQAVLDAGGDILCWAVNPLDAKAARLSFHELGAVCREYAPSFPDLPKNEHTRPDVAGRLIALWQLESERTIACLGSPPPEQVFPLEACLGFAESADELKFQQAHGGSSRSRFRMTPPLGAGTERPSSAAIPHAQPCKRASRTDTKSLISPCAVRCPVAAGTCYDRAHSNTLPIRNIKYTLDIPVECDRVVPS